MKPPERRRIRRILVALDASADSEAALELSAGLAARLGAELVGVYVEDDSLVGVAGLPFAQEVSSLSGRPRPLQARILRDQLKALGRRSRERLRGVAEVHRITWSFRTVQGRPAVRLRELAEEADLVTLGIRGRTPGRGPGSTTLALGTRGRIPTLVAPRNRRAGKTVHVLYDGSGAGREALVTATELARASGQNLVVLLPYDGSDEGGGLEEEARKLLQDLEAASGETKVASALQKLSTLDPIHLGDALIRGHSDLLVLPRSAVAQGGRLDPWAVAIKGGCSLLLVG